MKIGINYRQQYARYKRYFRQLVVQYRQRPEVKASVELLLTLLAISFFAVFALRPTLNTIASLWANIQAQKEVSVKLEEKISNLGRAQLVWSQEEARVALLDQAMPQEPQPDTYLQQIEGLVATNNVSLTSFNVEKVVLIGKEEKKTKKKDKDEIANARDLNLAFAVSGDFSSLMAFLNGLEDLRRLIVLDSASFGVGQGKQSGSLILTVAGKVPYWVE